MRCATLGTLPNLKELRNQLPRECTCAKANACVRHLQEAASKADVAAGLSLGEYSALAYAGAIEFEDGVRLVKLRGESMQAAADARPSGMVSVIGLDAAKVRLLGVTEPAAQQGGIVRAAHNSRC